MFEHPTAKQGRLDQALDCAGESGDAIPITELDDVGDNLGIERDGVALLGYGPVKFSTHGRMVECRAI